VHTARNGKRDKLGVALAGGGFRASLFHLGVLRRLAELDLLRHVQVLSTVSGGAIIGSLYMLVLKRYMDEHGSLSRDQYIAVMDEVQDLLTTAIGKNLRTRLLMNPFRLFRIITTPMTVSQSMARLYERHIYRDAVSGLKDVHPLPGRLGAIALRELKIKPGGDEPAGGIDAHNLSQAASGGSSIPKLVLNATSLNTGSPFRFSSSEIGDSRLGYFRNDGELQELLLRRKLFHAHETAFLQERLDRSPGARTVIMNGETYEYGTISLALWWRTGRRYDENRGLHPWDDLFRVEGFPGLLPGMEFGTLRRMKLSAWYILKGMGQTPPIDGGMTVQEHLDVFWEAMRQVDEELADRLEPKTIMPGQEPFRDLVLKFFLELYLLRSAEVVSEDIASDWDHLTLGDAVGASACFPPVFPPFQVLGFYDDLHVTRLGLTDGGVYDNMGLDALIEENCTWLIVSDTSGLFHSKQRVSRGRVGMCARMADVLMNDVATKQKEMLRTRRRFSMLLGLANRPSSQLTPTPEVPLPERFEKRMRTCYETRGLAFFHIDSVPLGGEGCAPMPPEIQHLIARLRTDLDGFGAVETAALVNHGYDMADRYVRKYFGQWPHKDPAHWKPAQTCPFAAAFEEREKKILDAGSSRFLRALRLGAPVSWVFTIAAVCALVYLTRDVELSVRQIVETLAAGSLAVLRYPLEWIVGGWTDLAMPVPVLLVSVILAAGAFLACREWCSRQNLRCVSLLRFAAGIRKAFLGYSGNAAWVLSLILTAIVCLGISCLAWVSHVFFYLPFKAAADFKAAKDP
jgi:predicted acylesterase/phospholipase RssA